MAKLGTEIDFILNELSTDAGRMMRIERMRQAFARAIRKLWAGNPTAVRMILQHINAVYVRKDDRPRKGPGKHEAHHVCEVYSDDSIVRAELDNWRQLLQLALHEQGISFDELRIIPSRLGMKERHPFEKLLELDLRQMDEELRKEPLDAASTLTRTDDEKLALFKRAIILTFPEHAEGVLEKMNAVSLTPVPIAGLDPLVRGAGGEFCTVFSEEGTLREVLMLYKKKIADNSRKIGLKIRSLRVLDWKGPSDARAFPRAARACATEGDAL